MVCLKTVGNLLATCWQKVDQTLAKGPVGWLAAGWRQVGGGLAAGWRRVGGGRGWRRERLAGCLALGVCVWRLAGWCSGLQCLPMVFKHKFKVCICVMYAVYRQRSQRQCVLQTQEDITELRCEINFQDLWLPFRDIGTKQIQQD